MGNQTAKPVDQKTFIEHQKLGSTRLFEVTEKNEDGESEEVQKMQITRNVESRSVYNQWVLNLNKINDNEGQQLFLVPQTHQFQKIGFCGDSGFAKLTFNKFEFVLSSQIKNRNNLNKYFDQTQIWYVLYNLVRAGNKFEILKQKIGDIHPNNILINEDGQTAIISQLSVPGQIDNFQKYLEDHKAEVFLAPEQMKLQDIQKGAYNQKLNKCLAEVFSLGMTLLSAGTLEHCNDVYQRQPFKINTQRLNVLLDQFSKRYSVFLTQTLKSMLEFNPEQRVKSKKLYELLAKYENQILDLQPFQVNQYPQGYTTPYNGYYNQPYGQPNGNTAQNPPQYIGNQHIGQTIGYGQTPNVRFNDNTIPIQVKRF